MGCPFPLKIALLQRGIWTPILYNGLPLPPLKIALLQSGIWTPILYNGLPLPPSKLPFYRGGSGPLYFTMGCPFPPQNCPFTEGDLDPYVTHGCLGPPSPHWYLNQFSHFCRVQDRNRQTDRPCYSIYNNRPYLRTQYYDAA